MMKRILIFALALSLFAAPAWAGRAFVRASSEKIEVASGLPDWTTKLTIGGWWYVSSTPSSTEAYTLFSKGRSGVSNDWNINLSYQGLGAATIWRISWSQPAGTSIGYTTGNALISHNVWTHIVWTIDWTTNPDTVVLYRNCLVQIVPGDIANFGGTDAAPTTTATQVAKFGTQWNDINYLNGGLAEWFVMSDTITAGQAKSLCKGMSPLGLGRRLDAYWPIWGRTSPEHELFNRLTGTLTGTAHAAHPRIFYPRGMK